MSYINSHYRNCNICEAMSGLEIKYQDKNIISIKGDQKDPLVKVTIAQKQWPYKIFTKIMII
ncbi:MAG: hypothetical protein ACJA2G_001759 [Cognaticolwellia sp.]|jgi:hypothetical protein